VHVAIRIALVLINTEGIIIIESIVPSRNIGCLWVLFTCLSAAKNLSSFQLLPASLITDLLQLFLGLLLFLFPWGFQSRAAFGISPSLFLNVSPIHLNFLFLISKFISSCPITFHRSLLEKIFGHHILNIYLRPLFTEVCILRWISFVTSQVPHLYKSTDFTQALNVLILVSFHNDLENRRNTVYKVKDTASVTALIKPYIPYSKVERFSLQVFPFYQVHIKFISITHAILQGITIQCFTPTFAESLLSIKNYWCYISAVSLWHFLTILTLFKGSKLRSKLGITMKTAITSLSYCQGRCNMPLTA